MPSLKWASAWGAFMRYSKIGYRPIDRISIKIIIELNNNVLPFHDKEQKRGGRCDKHVYVVRARTVVLCCRGANRFSNVSPRLRCLGRPRTPFKEPIYNSKFFLNLTLTFLPLPLLVVATIKLPCLRFVSCHRMRGGEIKI